MEEQIRTIKSYLAGVWLSRKYILIFAWVICSLGWLSVSMLPSQYTSKAVVYADTQSILKPLLRGLTIYTDPSQKLRLVANTLLNTSNLETIGEQVDVGIRANNEQEYNALIRELRNGIKIQSTKRDNLYTISFTGEQPIYVRDVVQSAVNVFIESILGDKRTDSEEAQTVISDQISFYENRLITAEKKLADFKKEYIGLMPNNGSSYYSTLTQQKKQLENDTLLLQETQSRIAGVRQQIKELSNLSASQADNIVTEHDERIDAIEIRLDSLLFRFTEKHPDVIETRRQLAEVKQLKRDSLQGANPEGFIQDNPIYRNLKITLNDLSNEYTSLKVRIEKHQENIVQLQSKLDLIPEVEAMLTSLNRDYAITKKKYETLLSRGETASISNSVDSVSEDIKFRIIEAPNLPSSPSGPNRTLYVAVILVLGLGAGIGFSLLVSLVRPVVNSVEQIHKQIGIPVIGIVSATEKSGYKSKENIKKIVFALMLMLLIMLFFFVMFRSDLVMLIGQTFLDLMNRF